MHTTLIYTDTQTTQPHSRLSLSNALSTTLLGPCHRKQHAPAGVVSQPERCSCLLPWNDLTTIQAHEYLHLRPLARNPHSQTLHDNILALPNVFPLRHTVMTNYSPPPPPPPHPCPSNMLLPANFPNITVSWSVTARTDFVQMGTTDPEEKIPSRVLRNCIIRGLLSNTF